MQAEIADRLGQADTLDSIAVAHRSLARYDEATAYYQQALQLYREFGDRYYEAQTLVYLGDTSLAADRLESAVMFWQNAVTIFDDLGLPEAASQRAKLTNLAGLRDDAVAGDLSQVASAT
jgi:tetratricopeptide (TPR) repeat protein